VPDLEPAVRGPNESSLRKSKENDRARAREQARAAQAAWKSDIANSLKALQGSLSNNTTIEPVGTGGEAYANYAQAIKTIYTEAWITPEDVNDESATVQVTVIIARDGRVLSSSILKRTGIPALDRSVQNVLDRVRKLPSFPEGANDLQRTFRLNFNLKSKRTPG
jgi:TonB family protein